MAIDPTLACIQTLTLKALRLRASQTLQIHSESAGASKEEVQFLAAIENKGVMVGPHSTNGVKNTLEPGAEYTVRGFNGQYDFSFTTRGIQIFEQPFVYAMLAYPDAVEARLVRRALRLKTTHPAKVIQPDQPDPLEVTLIDVSRFGSMVHSPATLGMVGNFVDLSFLMEFEGDSVNLSIPSKICHSNKSTPDSGFNVGLAFQPASNSDKLLLHFLAQSSSD